MQSDSRNVPGLPVQGLIRLVVLSLRKSWTGKLFSEKGEFILLAMKEDDQ